MRGKSKLDSRKNGVTIIRREEVVEGGHHGGAWKVAYADFVTAMMAFFLLMWLLNATTEDQRKGLADYFSPNNLLSHASSGTGKPFGGHTVSDHGGMVSDRGAAQVVVGKRPVVDDPSEDDADTPQLAERHGGAAEAGPPGDTDTTTPGASNVAATTPNPSSPSPNSPSPNSPVPGSPNRAAPNRAAGDSAASQAARLAEVSRPQPAPPPVAAPAVARAVAPDGSRAPTEEELRAEQARREQLAFHKAAEEIRQAVKDDPALAALSRQLAIDITPQGLRIQLLDEERLPMFATGSSAPNERARLLLTKVAPVLGRLPEDIAMVGHTDATPYAGSGKTNWELSTERANATRRLLTDAGLAETRVTRVTGLADRDPLLPADPFAAENRRIAIIVLNEKPRTTVPAGQPSGVSRVVPAGPAGTGVAASVTPTPLTAPQSPAVQLPAGQPPSTQSKPVQLPPGRSPPGPSQLVQPLVQSPAGLPPPVQPPGAQSPLLRAAVQARPGALQSGPAPGPPPPGPTLPRPTLPGPTLLGPTLLGPTLPGPPPLGPTPLGPVQSSSAALPAPQPPSAAPPPDDTPPDAPFADAPFSKPVFAPPPTAAASKTIPP
jgi:chemotaxis protein MotB